MIRLTIFFSLLCSAGFAQNVGINTPSPRAHLEIQSDDIKPNLWLNQSSLNEYNRIRFMSPSPNSFWDMAVEAQANPSNSRIHFYYSNPGVNLLSLTGNGRLGIGNSNPQEALHVMGNITMQNSNKGIILNNVDAPIITRVFDTFTSGLKSGVGRWGLFMEPSQLVMGIPNLTGKSICFAKYNADGTFIRLGGFDSNGSLNVSNLAGTHTSALVADAAGNVTRDERTQYLRISPYEFYSNDKLTFGTNLKFRGTGANVLLGNVRLPEGASISRITISYYDNYGDYKMKFNLFVTGTSDVIAYYGETTGAAFAERSMTLLPGPGAGLINNQNYYTMNVQPIYEPTGEILWYGDINQFSISKILIEYQL